MTQDKLSLCEGCYCSTKTIKGKCGKCKADKPAKDWRQPHKYQADGEECFCGLQEGSPLHIKQSAMDEQVEKEADFNYMGGLNGFYFPGDPDNLNADWYPADNLLRNIFNQAQKEARNQALTEVLTDVIGEDEVRVSKHKRGTHGHNLDHIVSIRRNQLKAEQRTKLNKLLSNKE